VKKWHSEWFYAGNMLPTLAVHSCSGPSVNDHWEKNPLSSEELKKSSHLKSSPVICVGEFNL
jgi:hypothetical protein